MGCGCGGSKKKVKVDIKSSRLRKICENCKSLMGYKTLYSAKAKGYIKKWECPRCKTTLVLPK